MDTTAYSAKTTTTVVSEGPGMGFDRSYLTSLLGILTAVIVGSAFCLAISASVPPLTWNGTSIAAYSSFVGWEAFVFVTVIFLFYMLRVLPKLPGPMGLVMLIYLLINIIFLFISIVLCAISIDPHRGPAGAAMVFGLIAIGCHFAVGFLLFQKWRTSGHYFHKGECGHTFTSATTTTTTTAAAGSAEPGRF